MKCHFFPHFFLKQRGSFYSSFSDFFVQQCFFAQQCSLFSFEQHCSEFSPEQLFPQVFSVQQALFFIF